MYRRRWPLKASLSCDVLRELTNFFRPPVASSFSSAAMRSGPTMRWVWMSLAISSSRTPREAWYEVRFLGIVVQ